MIQAGVVTVNGEVVTELGTKVNVLKDEIRFNGERLKGEEKIYIVMNKPKGFVTSASDPHAEKTVMDLIKGCSARVFPVGRLDKNTTGVLMFTNDGEIAEQLTAGDGNPLVRNITLIPGESIEEFAAKLVKNGVLESADRFLELCRTGEEFKDYYYIADILSGGNASQRKYVLEGYLAPNTYEVYTSADEEEIIRKLLSQTEAVFPEEYQEQAETLGMTMDQILTLASMVEKEAKEQDFARVSAVFHNRLRAGMKLESDVTVHYITGVRRMSLTEEDLNRADAYNTYLYRGLPPGPICNPSPAAIKAALYPDQTLVAEKYLFFCAKEPESGELYFSRTLEEHERAVAVYAPLWKQYDQTRGLE